MENKILLSLPEKKFHTIVADPPWPYDDLKIKGYDILSIDEIKKLNISSISRTKAHLYLWVPYSFIKEGLEVVEDWGFEYIVLITWLKLSRKGNRFASGLGHYFIPSTEFILFCTKGRMKTKTSSQRNIIVSPQGKHSEKPQRFLELVEEASPGPYIELFSRRDRKGWYAWGNEKGKLNKKMKGFFD